MIDKKIEEAKEAFIADKKILGIVAINDLACGFKEGAKWAINEFLKGLWHPASEKPKEFNHYGFAALYVLQYNHQIRMVLYDKDNMSWKNVISSNEYWLYVEDLLPKKGGEK